MGAVRAFTRTSASNCCGTAGGHRASSPTVRLINRISWKLNTPRTSQFNVMRRRGSARNAHVAGQIESRHRICLACVKPTAKDWAPLIVSPMSSEPMRATADAVSAGRTSCWLAAMIEMARHSSRQNPAHPDAAISMSRSALALTARTNVERFISKALACSGPSVLENVFHASSQQRISPVERPPSQQRKPMPTRRSGARAGNGNTFADDLAGSLSGSN